MSYVKSNGFVGNNLSSRLKTDSLTLTNTLLTIFHLKWWSLELLKLLGKFLGNYDFLTRSYHDAFDYYNFLEGSSDICNVLSDLQILKDCLQSSIVLPSWIQITLSHCAQCFFRQKSISADDFVVFAKIFYCLELIL